MVVKDGKLHLMALDPEGARHASMHLEKLSNVVRLLDKPQKSGPDDLPDPARVPRAGLQLGVQFPIRPTGSIDITITLHWDTGDYPVFRWIEWLDWVPRECIKVQEEDLELRGDFYVMNLDYDTGLPARCETLSPSGQSSRIVLLDRVVDQPLDESIFRVEGEAIPGEVARPLILEFVMETYLSQYLDMVDGVENKVAACLRTLPLLTDLLWTPEERQRLEDLATRHVEEVAAELKKETPEATDTDCWTAACQTSIAFLGEIIEAESVAEFRILAQGIRLQDPEQVERFWQEYEQLLLDHFVSPIHRKIRNSRE